MLRTVPSVSLARSPGFLRYGAAGAVSAVYAAKAPATPDADEARRAASKELSRPIYHQGPGLWQRIRDWILDHLDTGSMVPGVPSWVSTAIVVTVVAIVVALLILLVTRVSSARRVATPSLSVLTDDRDAATLTRASDFATAVVERFRAIIRSLDERGIIDEYPGMTALEAAALAHRALGTHPVVTPLHEAAHLFDAVLYGHVVSTRSQDRQMRELAAQVVTITLPAGRPLAGATAAGPGAPA